MMYEMLYGFTPFKGDQVVTTYSNIMNHKVSKKLSMITFIFQSLCQITLWAFIFIIVIS